MADAAVSFLVSDVVLKLTSSTIHKFRLLEGLEDDVSALRTTLEQIQAVLQDAEVKQRNEKAVETWLKTLRSVSMEMENVLDEVSAEAMQQRLQVERGIKYRVRAFFSTDHNQLLFRIRIIHKLKNIRRRLDAIAAHRSNFHLIPAAISVDARVGGDRRSTETSSLVHLSKICGRGKEMEMIAQTICSEDIVRHNVDDVRVYAIWGMGGVEKTTLAQLVYNHEKVKTHFELKAWVYVSTEFEIEKVTRGIIESISGDRCKLVQLDTMQAYLQDLLRHRRFLIVLDDVWNDNNKKWEEVSKALSCGAEGSIVMVTTRSQNISTMMAKVPEFVHKVGCLSEDDSWSLFKKLAFGVGREGEDISELEPVGREIVEKCKGLPLAVTALGSLMWSKNSVIEWKHVKDNDIWELQRDEVHILPALELSYDNLLPHMKRCFAYCCMFPKGYEMCKDLLIKLWIANGFIIQSSSESDLYVIGEEIFNCLRMRSFFQDMEKHKFMGWICKMHDMMHDLARYVMGHDCLVIEPGRELIILDDVLHLSSSCPNLELSDQDSKKLRSIRSIFIFAHEYKGLINQILEHKYLRVLHLIGYGGTTLPESVGNLKHLRYFNLSGSNIEVLPESIVYLQNLQVLILHSCMKLHKLPEDMRYLRNLQCLDIRYIYKLQGMPVGIKKLACLRRLSNFIPDEKSGTRLGELGDLNLLGCELKIEALENAQGFGDARSANLSGKAILISLFLCWGQRCCLENVESVLEGLEPNSNLKELEIRNYPGENISPSWMMDLRNLVSIKIWNCNRCDRIIGLGKLPCLKRMDIVGMHNLISLLDEDNTTSEDDILFPSLEILHISNCLKLSLLSSYLPKLKELDIKYCPTLCSLPDGLQKLTHLRIFSCSNRCDRILGLRKLPNLKSMDIRWMHNLRCLHGEDYPASGDDILFPSLEILHISGCLNLSLLPSKLPKLKELDIEYCPALHSFPDGLQRRLRELTHLRISGCKDLVRRCEKEIGEDWPKISCVRNIHLRCRPMMKLGPSSSVNTNEGSIKKD